MKVPHQPLNPYTLNNRTLLGLSLLALSVSAGQAAMAAGEKGEGFIEGSSLTILNRNLYFNRDFRKGQSSSSGNGYSEEWAHGVIGRFESGFTEGTIGFGVDAFAMLGIKLDTGDGRSGAGGTVDVLPYNSLGQAEDNYSKLGGRGENSVHGYRDQGRRRLSRQPGRPIR